MIALNLITKLHFIKSSDYQIRNELFTGAKVWSCADMLSIKYLYISTWLFGI